MPWYTTDGLQTTTPCATHHPRNQGEALAYRAWLAQFETEDEYLDMMREWREAERAKPLPPLQPAMRVPDRSIGSNPNDVSGYGWMRARGD